MSHISFADAEYADKRKKARREASDLCRCGRVVAPDHRKPRLAWFLLTQSRKGMFQSARRQEDDNTIGGCVAAPMRESISMGSRVP